MDRESKAQCAADWEDGYVSAYMRSDQTRSLCGRLSNTALSRELTLSSHTCGGRWG